MQSHSIENPPPGHIVSYNSWIKGLDRTRSTGHRWRKEYPWLNQGIINVFGMLYISRDTIAEFERRALAGELAKDINVRTGGGFI